MVSRHRTVCALLAIASMLTSFAATCAAGAAEPEQMQMACCKAGHHTCRTPAKPADCCKSQSSHEQQLTTAKATSLTQPVWTPLAWLAPALSLPPSAQGLVRSVRVDASPPLRPDRPAYLRFSVLLI